MGRLFKRGGKYYADLRSEGLGKRSLDTEDRKVAKKRLRAAELGATGDTTHPPTPLAVAVDNMIGMKRDQTAAFYKKNGLHLFRIFGADCDINTLTAAAVADYVIQRKAEKVSAHTIQKELVCLRQTLKDAKRRKEYGGALDIVPPFKAEYEPKTRWLTQADFARLLAEVPEQHRTWLMVQAYTGAELGAVRRLTWEHVNLPRKTITIPGTKRASRFRVDMPLHAELAAWLRRKPRTEPLIAPWPSVSKDLAAACKRLGIPRVSTNDLRRTFGSWLVQAGVDLLHVSRLMGHSSTAMVAKVYGQTSGDSFAAAIARLPKMKRRPARVSPHPTPRKPKGEDET